MIAQRFCERENVETWHEITLTEEICLSCEKNFELTNYEQQIQDEVAESTETDRRVEQACHPEDVGEKGMDAASGNAPKPERG